MVYHRLYYVSHQELIWATAVNQETGVGPKHLLRESTCTSYLSTFHWSELS